MSGKRKKRGKSADKPMSVGSHDVNAHEDSDSHDDPLSAKKAKSKQEPTENEEVTEKEEMEETEEDREEKDKGGSEDGKEDMVKVLGKLLKIASKPEKNDQGLSARAILDLQVSWLRNLQPFNPDREDLAAWCSMVEELLPPDTVPKDALRLLGTRLPRHLGEILRNCIKHTKSDNKKKSQ